MAAFPALKLVAAAPCDPLGLDSDAWVALPPLPVVDVAPADVAPDCCEEEVTDIVIPEEAVAPPAPVVELRITGPGPVGREYEEPPTAAFPVKAEYDPVVVLSTNPLKPKLTTLPSLNVTPSARKVSVDPLSARTARPVVDGTA